eukprot:TRINITY_DN8413_c0_g1_i3.p1 TRINITY_DN8413_c0_g1~~TRINITY_DN8413_c0_g1_i3.p1  ORF type:complete len:400 (+),score=63.35 TRINITY_DN8413_c0_g1_i3:62-1201(+)
MADHGEELVQQYVAEHGRVPETTQQLQSFAMNRDLGSLTYGQAREALAKCKDMVVPLAAQTSAAPAAAPSAECGRPTWLSKVGPAAGQMGVPPAHWSLRVTDLKDLLESCRACSGWRDGMNMYEVVDEFIIPWTQGTGCSYALLANADKPLPAKLMISHNWTESFDTFVESVVRFCISHGIPLSTPVWVCAFAIYQCDDKSGPSRTEQVAMEPPPFSQVIESKEVRDLGMLIVHNNHQDLYQRLWCVHELSEADKLGVPIRGVFPAKFNVMDFFHGKEEVKALFAALKLNGGCVASRLATCGYKADEDLIRGLIEASEGSYERVDERISKIRQVVVADVFRRGLVEDAIQFTVDWDANGVNSILEPFRIRLDGYMVTLL